MGHHHPSLACHIGRCFFILGHALVSTFSPPLFAVAPHYRGCQYMSCSWCDLCHCTRGTCWLVIDFSSCLQAISLFWAIKKISQSTVKNALVKVLTQLTSLQYLPTNQRCHQQGKYDIPFFDSLHTSALVHCGTTSYILIPSQHIPSMPVTTEGMTWNTLPETNSWHLQNGWLEDGRLRATLVSLRSVSTTVSGIPT